MKRIHIALILAVSLLLVGAVAQVTREEFDALADQVRSLRSDVALLKVRVRQLRAHIRGLEQEETMAAVPPASPAVRGESGLPLWVESAHCRYRVHCDYCLGDEQWHQSIGATLGYEMPAFGTCPYGMTLAAARQNRLDLIATRVADGLITPEQGYAAAVKLGLIEGGAPAPWDDESRLDVGDDRRHRVAVTCGGGCGGLCFGCPVLNLG